MRGEECITAPLPLRVVIARSNADGREPPAVQGVDDMERQARQCAEEQLVVVSQRLAVAEEALSHHK